MQSSGPSSEGLRLETIAIGDELLTGKISDTNSQYVAGALFAAGLRLDRTTVIPDVSTTIQQALRASAARSDFVICFGGLGPTSDDRTAEAVAGILGGDLITHLPTREKLEAYCLLRNRAVTVQNLKQTLYPGGSEPFDNPVGMAVGFWIELDKARIFFLPGVPAEMKGMFQATVLPAIVSRAGVSGSLRHHVWRCVGVPESDLQRAMVPVESSLPPRAWLGYRTRFPENHLTLYWRVEEAGDDSLFAAEQQRIRNLVSEWAYAEEDQELEQLVMEGLARRGMRLALAESCTGGLTAHRLTRVPGASEFLWGGFTCYQNSAKEMMLGVTLKEPSEAVSASCTRRLAEAALQRSGCDIAAAITGYMGPSGGSPQDPIGRIYLCVIAKSKGKAHESKLFSLAREREQAQWGAATYLLNAIRIYLEGHA